MTIPDIKVEIFSNKNTKGWAYRITVDGKEEADEDGLDEFEDAEARAVEEMRLVRKKFRYTPVRARLEKANAGLASLSEAARACVLNKGALASAATVSEIAGAIERGVFDYGDLRSRGLRLRDDVASWVAARVASP